MAKSIGEFLKRFVGVELSPYPTSQPSPYYGIITWYLHQHFQILPDHDGLGCLSNNNVKLCVGLITYE